MILQHGPRTLRTLLCLLALLLPAFPACADLADTIARIKPSLVVVGTFNKLKSPAFAMRGTGFVVGDGQLVATNAHVIPDAPGSEPGQDTLMVLARQGEQTRPYPARLITRDVEHDLAVLRISGPALPALTLGASDAVREGQSVAFSGFPIGGALGFSPVTHRGMISSITPIAIPIGNSQDLKNKSIRRLRSGAFPIASAISQGVPVRMLGFLQKQGLIWKHGRHWVVITPEHYQILDGLRDAVVMAQDWNAQELAERALIENVDPMLALNALSSGMRHVERLYVANELELADLIWSAAVMKNAMNVIEVRMVTLGQQVHSLGTVVFGTVEGDVHDLGKNIVSMFLTAHGFRVIDLGVDVPTERFVEAVRQHHPDILALSALLTTTAQHVGQVILALEKAGLRARVKVIVGGEPMTPHLATEVGADGYAPSAREAVALAWRLTQS